MNPRIQELAQQATTYIEPTSTSGEGWIFDKEKFAELIVQECAGVIENKMPDFTCKEDYENLIRKAGRMDAIDEIKEHFGVE